MAPKPKKQVNPEERMRRIVDLGLALEAVYLPRDMQVELRIRYDPNLITSTQIDPTIMDLSPGNMFLLKWHWSLLDVCCKMLDFGFSIGYDEFTQRLQAQLANYTSLQVGMEICLLISPDGTTQVSCFELEPRLDLLSGVVGGPSEIQYHLYMDTEHTAPSMYTTFPLVPNHPTERAASRIEEIRGEFADHFDTDGRPIATDIILINPNKEVIGGSQVGIAFFRDGFWVTPEVLSGCRLEPMREMLQSVCFLEQVPLLARDVKEGEEVLVFNSVIGVARGKIMNTAINFMEIKKTRADRPGNRIKARQRQMSDLKKQEDSYRAELNSAQVQKMAVPAKTRKRQKQSLPGSSVFKF